MTLHDVGLPPVLTGRHVLLVPRDTDLPAYAAAWFAGARWVRPRVPARAPVALSGARFRGLVEPGAEAVPGVLHLDDDGALEGPVPLDADTVRLLGLGPRELDAYTVGPADPARATDPAAVGRVTAWAAAVARRLGGAIVPADRTSLVVPDHGADVDLTLWSPLPLAVQDALLLVRPALQGARIGTADVPQAGRRAEGSFRLTAEFEYDGEVVVRVGREASVPLVLSAVDSHDHGPWAYRVQWVPTNPDELAAAQPSPLHVIARARVSPGIARATSALWRAVGGTVVDASGFVVTQDDLRRRGGL